MKKIMIMDQGDPVAYQILGKAKSLYGDDADYVMVKFHKAHNQAMRLMEKAIADEKPDVILIGATALGEEVAPALGIRLETGVAAHCIDIIRKEDELAFMVPAFGGKVIGEIFVPGWGPEHPAIATVKPGTFDDSKADCRVIDFDVMIEAGEIDSGRKTQGTFRLTGIEPRKHAKSDISKAQLIFCGGFGIGSTDNWQKIEKLAEKFGGGAGCTRPALDMDWGPDESSMIGTSGKTVKPKVYIGFGVSGAAHHVCGIKDADVIISINNDKDAEVFAVSDYKGVFDAEAVIDALLEEDR
ncbi:MAG: electron transfer flavoprotein subunit alpha/FixB family protein [Clostridia bacterium]|nr:electron transfer flavoprotein subunit alpha/FixB family protein [Clostridia bacterium]